MKLVIRPLACLLASIVGLASFAASARDYKVGPIEIKNPWSRATPKGAAVAAGYMKITNTGTEPDRLTGGSSDIATFQIHEMTMAKEVAKMRPLAGGLEIKPGQTVDLAPSSFHVMFVGLKHPLAAGDRIKATLMFEKAGPVDVEYEVLGMGATPGNAGPKDTGHAMPGMQHGH
jgi:copper(I)-binding protein